jgi:hypothetical protein
MEITGKIFQILPEETGEGRNGPWKKQSFILETQDQYPKKVCITVWGDRIDLSKFQENDVVTAGINIESREYNGRWYTDVKAWRIDTAQEKDAPQGYQNIPPEKELPPEVAGEPDDLPF